MSPEHNCLRACGKKNLTVIFPNTPFLIPKMILVRCHSHDCISLPGKGDFPDVIKNYISIHFELIIRKIMGWGEDSGPESKPQYCQKEKDYQDGHNLMT
jgi:hypothetical protein